MAFDYDLFVIGGGSGGVRAARIVTCSMRACALTCRTPGLTMWVVGSAPVA